MNITIDHKAEKQWNKSNDILKYHLNYIKGKRLRCELDFIDLILVSNFKGGNSTIVYEKNNQLEIKLVEYSKLFKQIELNFKNKTLSQLDENEFIHLKYIIKQLIDLCYSKDYNIIGFKASYLSALLNTYFPNLIPILDRRILINLNLINNQCLNNQSQVKNIQNHYLNLLEKIKNLSYSANKTIREIDKQYFIIKLPDWSKRKLKSL